MAIFSSAGGGGGGGGSPGGSNTQFQFNNAGAFGGSTNFEFDSPNAAVRGLTGLTRGIELFNTADITTNTERLRFYWTSNLAVIGTDTQGSGSQREVTIGTFSGGSGQNRLRFFTGGSTTQIQSVGLASGNPATVHFTVTPGAFSAASGIQTIFQVTPSITQSGTAGYTGISINATETSTGSGAKNLILATVGGTSRYRVDNLGNLYQSSTATNGLQIFNTADEVTNVESFRAYWAANVLTIATDTAGTGAQREMRIGSYAGGTAQNYFRLFGTGGSVSCQLQLANSGAAGIVGFNVAPNSYSAGSGIQTVMQIQGTCSQSGTAGFNGLLVNPTISTTGSGSNWLLQVQNSSSFRAGVAVNGQLRISSGTGQVDFSPSGNTLLLATGAVSSGTISFQIGSGTMSTHASGSWAHTSIVGSVNQSGTAAYTGLLVNITETATGSGAKKLIDTQIAGVTNFSILNNGRIQYIAGNTATTVGAAGGGAALPATPTGYCLIDIGGTAFKIPYYAN